MFGAFSFSRLAFPRIATEWDLPLCLHLLLLVVFFYKNEIAFSCSTRAGQNATDGGVARSPWNVLEYITHLKASRGPIHVPVRQTTGGAAVLPVARVEHAH